MKKLNDYPTSLQEFFSDLDEQSVVYERAKSELRKKFTHLKDHYDESFAWILTKSGLPWLPLDIEFPVHDMVSEMNHVKNRFSEHRAGYFDDHDEGNGGWKALCLHGISSTHTFNPEKYGYNEKTAPYKWTEIADLCPVTRDFFQQKYPCDEYYRVRFSNLSGGGFIVPHRDRFAKQDAENSYLWEVNLALTNPKGFYFKMEKFGYVPFFPGKAFVLDVSNMHSVVNLSDEERSHMIVHGNPISREDYRALITKSYQKFLHELFES